jgi:hypothetical protein
MFEQLTLINKGMNVIILDISTLVKGIYFLKIGSKNYRFIKG